MFASARRSNTLRAGMALLALLFLPTQVLATWSVIAVDARTGRVVIASATCVPQERLEAFPAAGLMDIQAIVVPGIGVAAAQAGVDRSRANQTLIYEQMQSLAASEETKQVYGRGPQGSGEASSDKTIDDKRSEIVSNFLDRKKRMTSKGKKGTLSTTKFSIPGPAPGKHDTAAPSGIH